MFKKGDRVICINNKLIGGTGNAPPLKLYHEYIINDIITCKCGAIAVDVGVLSKNQKVTSCNICDSDIGPLPTHWCNAIRFRKVEEQPPPPQKEYASFSTPQKKLTEIPISDN